MQEISLNVLDIAQNSVSAGASLIEITVRELERYQLEIVIKDNGRGMTKQQVENVIDPFYTTRTTRRVGLGVPFFKMAAEMTGGQFAIHSTLDVGTTVSALFFTDHVDCMPLGNMNDTIFSLVTLNGAIDFLYTYQKGDETYRLDTREMRDILGDIPFNNPEVAVFIRDYLHENFPGQTS